MKDFLVSRGGESTLAEAAARLSMSEVAAKVAVHRMRSRFGHLLRQEIQSTLESESDIDTEIAGLFAALGQ